MQPRLKPYIETLTALLSLDLLALPGCDICFKCYPPAAYGRSINHLCQRNHHRNSFQNHGPQRTPL